MRNTMLNLGSETTGMKVKKIAQNLNCEAWVG